MEYFLTQKNQLNHSNWSKNICFFHYLLDGQQFIPTFTVRWQHLPPFRGVALPHPLINRLGQPASVPLGRVIDIGEKRSQFLRNFLRLASFV